MTGFPVGTLSALSPKFPYPVSYQVSPHKTVPTFAGTQVAKYIWRRENDVGDVTVRVLKLYYKAIIIKTDA